MEDREILKLFYERSEQAIAELSRKYGRICRRIAFNILKNEHDVEECLSDAYLRVWETVPPHDPESLMSYACLAVRNAAMNRIKISNASMRPKIIDTDFNEILMFVEDSADVESIVEDREFENEINVFLQKLPKNDRVLFVKRYFCCERIENLARSFGMSSSSTSKKLARMREKLKKYLIEKGYTI